MQPYVSSYEEKLRAGLGEDLSKIPEDREKLFNDLVTKIVDEVQEKARSYTSDWLGEEIKNDIMNSAAAVASSMLVDALAGDDKQIRNLFGFNEWYMKWAYTNRELPTQWALIDAIVARRPDIFLDERLAQRDAQIEGLNREIVRLKERLRTMHSEQINAWDGI